MLTKIGLASAGALMTAALFAASAGAATSVVVTPTNTQGWSTADTRPGGEVNFVNDATSPYPTGALELKTSSSTDAKAQYLRVVDATTSLSSVTDLSYWTKQVSGPSFADPSLQLLVDLNGSSTGGFTTLVYEPYQNGTVTPAVWQQWNIASNTGQFWSTRSFTDATTTSCMVTAGAGGAPFYTLSQLQTACPQATVLGYGVNVGTNNPNYDVYTDGFTFNGTTYDFELASSSTSTPPVVVPMTKDECKNGGWKNVTDASSTSFKNQGDCVSFVATHGRNKAAGHMSTTTASTTEDTNNQ